MAKSAPSAHIDSWYAGSAAPLPSQARLQGRQRVDVAILGAGLTGLSAALELAAAGFTVAIVEARRIGWGASGRSGGQVIFGFGCGEAKIASLVGQALAKEMFDWSLEGVAMVRERIREHGIDAHWRDGHAHVAIKPRQVQELQEWQSELRDTYGYPLQWWDRERLQAVLPSPRYLGGLYDPKSGHLHPLEYTNGLARAALAAGVRIFEDSPVTALRRGATPTLVTTGGELVADHVVLAGNALLQRIAPELERKIMPVGTYIGATTPLPPELAADLIRNGMAVADINWALDYFRLSHDHRLLFGGRASYSTLPPPDLAGTMRRRMTRVFPQLAGVGFDKVWGGYVDISRNRAPHWGRLGDNVYFAQGFSGHGVAATGLAGRVIAEAIKGQATRLDAFAKIPHADFPGGRALRTPLLVAAMAWFKLRDALW
ncbi:NAD(P)/FAD-dependent oxidoreductase [Arenimonas composti]|uniref:FAD dependent oxidoreductase domain-containing protein n=1 Tax=Arenimonas composti TR7-09 = DSM 18010 TaxID=1121013 RepID=A0A091BL48_9GAMM|nr:FAD-binding oxidoreductase [Arenimonas composti]KFN51529.1 hypothetical protein P873_00280 [Arenimonas composti TR7-09 = DSM 18010]